MSHHCIVISSTRLVLSSFYLSSSNRPLSPRNYCLMKEGEKRQCTACQFFQGKISSPNCSVDKSDLFLLLPSPFFVIFYSLSNLLQPLQSAALEAPAGRVGSQSAERRLRGSTLLPHKALSAQTAPVSHTELAAEFETKLLAQRFPFHLRVFDTRHFSCESQSRGVEEEDGGTRWRAGGSNPIMAPLPGATSCYFLTLWSMEQVGQEKPHGSPFIITQQGPIMSTLFPQLQHPSLFMCGDVAGLFCSHVRLPYEQIAYLLLIFQSALLPIESLAHLHLFLKMLFQFRLK